MVLKTSSIIAILARTLSHNRENVKAPQYHHNRTETPPNITTADKYSTGLDNFPSASYTGHS